MLSMLSVWSMDKNKGAPSFFKTIKGYIDSGWNLTLILPENSAKFVDELRGIELITFKSIFVILKKIPKIGFIFSFLNILYTEYKFYSLGKNVLKRNHEKTIVYAYEVHGVKAGKKLSKKYEIPFISKFQGTILEPIKNTFFNRLLYYPHFSALKTEANVIIITDDGTFGDKVLKRLGNTTKKIYFWKNGVSFDSNNNIISTEKINAIRRLYKIEEKDHVLITISRLVYWKRVDRTIIAFHKIINDIPDCKLVIVGDGNDKVNLQKLSRKLGLDDKVIFTGAVSHNKVLEFLKLADIFLSSSDLSNVGNPLLEAMMSGKPIITLNTGNTSSIIKNWQNGVLVEVDELTELPEYIKKLLLNKKFALRLGNSAKKYAIENFWSWDERISAELIVANNLIK
jgi:glycosyltransferase involved in cell wall biosynthesis